MYIRTFVGLQLALCLQTLSEWNILLQQQRSRVLNHEAFQQGFKSRHDSAVPNWTKFGR